MGPMHGMYGVQRTNKRAEFAAFMCFLRKANGPTTVHVDNKGIVDGMWRGEMMDIGPKKKDADLWTCIWEVVHRVYQEGML